MDRQALIAELRGIVGDGHVLTDDVDLIVYEQDGSVLQAVPEIVVLPADTPQVAAVIRAAARAGVPVVPRGSGTGLAGGAVPAGGGVVVSLARLNRVRDVSYRDRTVEVEPGVINLDVTKAVAKAGFFYAPDPSSQAACSIGGNLANNSGGPHTLAYGVTTNHTLGMEVVRGDGSVVWLGGVVPDTPGYDLCGLFVGSEGTLGIVTRAVVRLMRVREQVGTLLAVFDRMDDATQAVVEITAAGIVPAALEMMDRTTIEAVERGSPVGLPRDADAVLLVEVEGVQEHTERVMRLAREICHRAGARAVRTAKDEPERAALWRGRKGAFGALGTLAPNYYVMDGVVPRSRLPDAMRAVAEISRRFGVRVANVFHAGDGNLHPNILFDLRVPGELERVLAAGAEILKACVAMGGSLTGEHGIGLEKREYMGWVFTPADLEAMARVRAAFDPDRRFNPGKIFPTPAACGEATRRMPARIPEGVWV
ncbi:MAG: FAD-linked oxidase C-terminal domain-containing protein [Armatimonadota bacterium]|nr:FAD-linked oxidase C-terminal domain-containing protein [Armatimonadota bacterium]MDR7494562.1 FAD-linked oxidase C-terminal domain-containing protein [Armatimonadota bacterium]MDR7504471.1 FAD-linked oxidase C-terminal domain-containing protein [Armatimonadota bacterium]MDR7558388.1 FAD-linked oxidase C-terminal domain-containing protein [Armatimonadota bacterium]